MNNNQFIKLVISELISILTTLLLIFVFAGIITQFTLNETAVKIINQAIKTIAILLGCIFYIKKKGILNGGIFGIIYAVCCFAVFGLISKEWNFDASLLLELIYSAIVGSISGVMGVSIKAK